MKQLKHVIAADLFPVSLSHSGFMERIVSDSGCMIVRQESGRATLRAPTELILESLLAQINERVQSPVKAGSCYVLYLETITRSAEAEGKEIDQSKERDHYGHVRLTLDPQELGEQFQFINAIQHGAIPEVFIPTIQQAISKGLQKGVLKGFPVVEVACTLFDGSYHDIDSSDEAFEKATLRALADGLSKAAPVLLEPIMRFEIRAPEELIPSVLADLKKRRAKIEEADASLHEGLVKGFIALAQVLGYHRVLEKMTDARAQLTLHPDHYARVLEEDSPDFPPAIAIAL